jgi:hypothetical protein
VGGPEGPVSLEPPVASAQDFSLTDSEPCLKQEVRKSAAFSKQILIVLHA